MATNTGVKGKVVVAGAPTQGIPGLTVAAFDIDPLSGDDHLGTTQTLADGTFSISYSPGKYRPWFVIPEVDPDIEVRIFGEGGRLLFETPKVDGVSDAVLDVKTIEIHESNVPVPDTATPQQKKDDPYWLVTHTTLDPKNGDPVRLTRGNRIDWLVDGDPMFSDLTDDIAQATTSIHFMNSMFYVKELKSKFEFPVGKNHRTVAAGDAVKVHRLERILRDQALNNRQVRVLTWDFRDSVGLDLLLFDRFDTADEVEDFFEPTRVLTDAFESTQLLHMKTVVIDGTLGYVLGSTMSQSYFGDREHLIRDARHGTGQLMHDVGLKVRGPAVRFVDQTFATVWNVDPSPVDVTPAPQQLPIGGGQAAIAAQVLRTLPGNVFTRSVTGPDIEQLPHGETGILEAYQRAIMKAEEYIYIEDQYFTSPEIASAIKIRMSQKAGLEVIVVLNVKPDIPGYHAKQNALIRELLDSLGPQKDRLGVFTMWSTDDTQPKFEIAHIYVHAKLAIIDDVWASVGSANIDGASLNQRQWGMIATGRLKEFARKDVAILTLIAAGLFVVSFIPIVSKLVFGGSLLALLSQMPFIISSLRKETARTTQHATPSRDTQPPRHPEINLAVYDGIAGQPATPAVKDLRDQLWTEQLGGPPPSVRPGAGWLSRWRAAAAAHLTQISNAAQGKPHQPTATKILEWSPQSKPEDYLKALGVAVKNIKVRGGGQKMPFQEIDAQPP